MIKQNNTIKLNDGRTFGFAEYGHPEGKPVIYFNGSGGSRLDYPNNLSMLSKIGVRLISTDRPGHGLSDPQPNRKLLDLADDISQLADQLTIDRFYVMGHSAGGPYALSCAYKLSSQINACTLVSSPAPPERPKPYKSLSVSFRVLLYAIRNYPKINYFFRKQMIKAIQGDVEQVGKRLLSGFPKEDQNQLLKPNVLKITVKALKEGYRQGYDGPAHDDIVINSPWEFLIQNITVPTNIWHGENDRNVPINQGEYLHKMIPNSKFTLINDQAHLYLYSMWEEILIGLIESNVSHTQN